MPGKASPGLYLRRSQIWSKTQRGASALEVAQTAHGKAQSVVSGLKLHQSRPPQVPRRAEGTNPARPSPACTASVLRQRGCSGSKLSCTHALQHTREDKHRLGMLKMGEGNLWLLALCSEKTAVLAPSCLVPALLRGRQ